MKCGCALGQRDQGPAFRGEAMRRNDARCQSICWIDSVRRNSDGA